MRAIAVAVTTIGFYVFFIFGLQVGRNERINAPDFRFHHR